MNFKKILVTTDFSNESTKAFEIAAHEAKMAGSEIHLAHVFDISSVAPLGLPGSPPTLVQEIYQEEKINSKNKLEEYAKKYFHDQKVTTKVIEKKQSIGADIAKYAKNNNCEAILIAKAGKGFIQKMFLGSNVQRLLNHAECPVIVVPIG